MPLASPLVPFGPDEVRLLYAMMREDLERDLEPEAAAQLALEAVAHAEALQYEVSTCTPRVLVLHGTDPGATVAAARALADVVPGLPRVEVPLTLVSEQGWAGKPLGEWLDRLWEQGPVWCHRGMVVLSGLECLRLPRGTYTVAKASGTTRDYRTGKSENLTALLSGQPAATTLMSWSAQAAFVVCAALYESDDHSADALHDWGLLPELAGQLATVPWVRIDAVGAGRVAERAIMQHLLPIRYLYRAAGYQLAVSPEAVRWAAARATERGESAAVAASWIAAPLRRRLIEMLAAGVTQPEVSVGPDDVTPPPSPSRGTWHD